MKIDFKPKPGANKISEAFYLSEEDFKRIGKVLHEALHKENHAESAIYICKTLHGAELLAAIAIMSSAMVDAFIAKEAIKLLKKD